MKILKKEALIITQEQKISVKVGGKKFTISIEHRDCPINIPKHEALETAEGFAEITISRKGNSYSFIHEFVELADSSGIGKSFSIKNNNEEKWFSLSILFTNNIFMGEFKLTPDR